MVLCLPAQKRPFSPLERPPACIGRGSQRFFDALNAQSPADFFLAVTKGSGLNVSVAFTSIISYPELSLILTEGLPVKAMIFD